VSPLTTPIANRIHVSFLGDLFVSSLACQIGIFDATFFLGHFGFAIISLFAPLCEFCGFGFGFGFGIALVVG